MGAHDAAEQRGAEGREILVAVDEIAHDFGNHRIEPPTPEDVASLAESIKEDGLLQAPLVRPRPPDTGGEGAGTGGPPYQLVFGHRRLLAVTLLGWEKVRVSLREELPEERGRVLQLRENLDRKDLSPIERAHGMQMILDAKKNLSRSTLARELGMTRSEVTKGLSLLGLPAGVQAWVHRGRLGKGHGELLARRFKGDAEAQTELASRAVKEGLDVRTLDAYAKEWIEAKTASLGDGGREGGDLEREEAFHLGPTQVTELRFLPGVLPEEGEEGEATHQQRELDERLGLYAKLCAFNDRELRERELGLPVPVTPDAAGVVMDLVFDLDLEEVKELSMRLNRRYLEAGHRARRVPTAFAARYMRGVVADPAARARMDEWQAAPFDDAAPEEPAAPAAPEGGAR